MAPMAQLGLGLGLGRCGAHLLPPMEAQMASARRESVETAKQHAHAMAMTDEQEEAALREASDIQP